VKQAAKLVDVFVEHSNYKTGLKYAIRLPTSSLLLRLCLISR